MQNPASAMRLRTAAERMGPGDDMALLQASITGRWPPWSWKRHLEKNHLAGKSPTIPRRNRTVPHGRDSPDRTRTAKAARKNAPRNLDPVPAARTGSRRSEIEVQAQHHVAWLAGHDFVVAAR